jgi:hypothetical protein
VNIVVVQFGVSLLEQWSPPSTVERDLSVERPVVLINWKSVVNIEFERLAFKEKVQLQDTVSRVFIVCEECLNSIWLLCKRAHGSQEPAVAESALSNACWLDSLRPPQAWTLSASINIRELHWSLPRLDFSLVHIDNRSGIASESAITLSKQR